MGFRTRCHRYHSRSDESRQSALRMQLAENLESIIREAVKPMENIEGIKIYEVNGMPGFNGSSANGGNGNGGGLGPVNGDLGGSQASLSDSIVNSALRYRAQMPFVDNLLNEIGMSPSEIGNITNILGDYKKGNSDGGSESGRADS